MITETHNPGAGGAALMELRESRAGDFDAGVLCLQPEALLGPVANARALLKSALTEPDRRLALELTRNALAGLSGFPGRDTAETRERLSRLFHRLVGEVKAVSVNGAAPRLDTEPEAGHLGPVERTCDTCGEPMEPLAPDTLRRHVATTCARCRAAARRARKEPTMEAALRLETVEQELKRCKECGKSAPEVKFRSTRFGELKTCDHCIGVLSRQSRKRNAEKAAQEVEDAPATASQEAPAVEPAAAAETPPDPVVVPVPEPAAPVPTTAPVPRWTAGDATDRTDGTHGPDPTGGGGRAALLAPVLLTAGLLGLASWVVGRAFHAVSIPTEP